MSDIEKQKELSGDGDLRNTPSDKDIEQLDADISSEKESSISADQGSVTNEEQKSEKKSTENLSQSDDLQPEEEETQKNNKSSTESMNKSSEDIESPSEHDQPNSEIQDQEPVIKDKNIDESLSESEINNQSDDEDLDEKDVNVKIEEKDQDDIINKNKDPEPENDQISIVQHENLSDIITEKEPQEKVAESLDKSISEEPDEDHKTIAQPENDKKDDKPVSEGETDEEHGEEDAEHDIDDEEEQKDYSTFSKDEIIEELNEILKGDDMKKIERLTKELKSFYDDLYENEKKEALKKFIDQGEAEVDFEYAGDALDSRFSALYDKYKSRRNHYYADLDKEKDINLQRKHEVLEKLRNLVDGEETTASISALKEIQKEWKSIGPVPGQYTKSLWATYNILIDRFYDNRSIYFELKELDRKKNLESKLELCERAEELAKLNSIREAVKELNELHEEFKHIGPVPKELQEEIWQRFKAASDAIYAKRKEFVGRLKKDLHENLKEKMELVEAVEKFKNFDSDRISDWNEKTREILEIQKNWDYIGGLPREHAKEVNKAFWTNFKSFFNNKNKFFKKLEGQRDENLTLKEELIKKAEELKESEEWDKTAEILKELQLEWKNIGPVPEKVKNEIYKRFKSACDTFFDRRRAHTKDLEGDYRDNLKQKEHICEEIEKMVDEKNFDTDKFKEFQMEFDKIGFVPRNAIRKIQKKYDIAVKRFLESVDLTGAEKSELKFTIEINRLKSSPNSDRRIQRKESELRRMISKIENDIALWKNNLEFFAESKTADKFREEFSNKIKDASQQLKELKEELKVLNKI